MRSCFAPIITVRVQNLPIEIREHSNKRESGGEQPMSKKCEITGKTVMYGNNVSHAHNKTRRRFLPNLQKRRIWIPEEGRYVTMRISTRAMRTLDKKGYKAFMKELGKI